MSLAGGLGASCTRQRTVSAAGALLTLARNRPFPNGKHDQVVDCWRVIHSLQCKPMALLNQVYRDRPVRRDDRPSNYHLAAILPRHLAGSRGDVLVRASLPLRRHGIELWDMARSLVNPR